ncbi:MAG: hypothetical protein IKB07_09375 [Lachnospiraceae bacterium]|nr:hypothetical protein [Lachnospiraceae bacterium]
MVVKGAVIPTKGSNKEYDWEMDWDDDQWNGKKKSIIGMENRIKPNKNGKQKISW